MTKYLNAKILILLHIICVLFTSSVAIADVITAKTIRILSKEKDTRVVIDVTGEVKYTYFTLTSPDRLVIDLENTKLKTTLPMPVTDDLSISRIRTSTSLKNNSQRLVFDLKQRSSVNIFPLKPNGQYGHRVVIDFNHVKVHGANIKADELTIIKEAPIKPKKDLLIVIDPGHGGKDPGSVGPKTNKYEKHTVLAISKKIANILNATNGITTKLTRTDDNFVSLDRRVAFARENNAHLLLSIHADAFTSPKPRGVSVFVLNTRRANTEIANWIENHEKQSEMLGGTGSVFVNNTNDKNINQTLLDLQFSHSQKEGYKLAVNILSELGKVTKVHKKKPINTSLAVLRSPQIPSVLIEVGFISNPVEEKLLFQTKHQNNIANAIASAVKKYLRENPPDDIALDNSFLQADSKYHIVKSGDYLSKIAEQYNVSAQKLRALNNLKSDKLQVGQKLQLH